MNVEKQGEPGEEQNLCGKEVKIWNLVEKFVLFKRVQKKKVKNGLVNLDNIIDK